MSAVQFLRFANLAVLLALTAVSLREWRSRPRPEARWLALTFAALFGLFALRALVGDPPQGAAEEALARASIALAVLYPYLLFRFSSQFSRSRRALELGAAVLVAALVTVGVLLPPDAFDREPRPGFATAFVAAIVAEWALASLLVAVRLWRAGRAQPRLVRKRMHFLSVASLILTLAVLLVAFTPSDRPLPLDLAFRSLLLASFVLFFVGFAPPRLLRVVWRQPEEEELRRALSGLLAAQTAADVTASVLPRMANLVGAHAIALLDAGGHVVASYASERARELELGHARAGREEERETDEAGEIVRLPIDRGSLVVRTSPYAPLFATDEFELLRSLASLTELALDRSRLFDQEREARVALERASEMKRNFIALASHELRSPATSVYGISETLERLGDRLDPEQVRKLRRMLHEQALRMTRLVEQLLDLSRLEAAAIEIKPEEFSVREHVEEMIEAIAGEQAETVAVDIDPQLEATADVQAFERIVSNLIANAVRHGTPPVTVTAEQRDRHFRLAVEDRGQGVKPEFVPKLFEPFARSEGSRARSGGTGLGLAIARSYAQAHNGELLYAEATPHGARFELVLPSS